MQRFGRKVVYVVIGDGVEEEQAAKKVMDPQRHCDPAYSAQCELWLDESLPFFAVEVLWWLFTFFTFFSLLLSLWSDRRLFMATVKSENVIELICFQQMMPVTLISNDFFWGPFLVSIFICIDVFYKREIAISQVLIYSDISIRMNLDLSSPALGFLFIMLGTGIVKGIVRYFAKCAYSWWELDENIHAFLSTSDRVRFAHFHLQLGPIC